MYNDNYVVTFPTEVHSELRAHASSVYGWVTKLMLIAERN